MFYYLVAPIMTYNFILIAAAVIPAIFLMVKVYKSDRLEKESPALLWKLVKAGILSSLLALVEEKVLSLILNSVLDANTVAYNIVLYFVVVACSEESSKYLFLRRNTWKNSEFNSQFDGVVYATFVSLGFALWENISYVLSYGFAKKYDYQGNKFESMLFRIFSFVLPALQHGAYDYIATMEQEQGGWYFVAFVAVLFFVSYILVGKASKKDRYI